MKIVQFKDGQFGIRKGWFLKGYTYLNMRNYREYKNIDWREREDKRIQDRCKCTLELAKEAFNYIKFMNTSEVGKPVSRSVYKKNNC